MLLDTGRKEELCYKVAKIMAEVSSRVFWKAAFVRDELGYFTGEVSKQSRRV